MNDKDKSYFTKLILSVIIFVSFLTILGLTVYLVKNKRAVNPQPQVSVSPEPTVYIKDEIKTGKVEIDYNAIEQTQKLVDSGNQPWQLNPIMVLKSEMAQYGFDEKDYNTLSNIPSAGDQAKFGADVTSVKVGMAHNDKIYTITLIQPIAGKGKIWTISVIEVKQKDETANWQTYKNEQYGFEFKYPENFKIKENIFDSPGKDWDGSRIKKLAIFDLFNNDDTGPIVNPSLRLSITSEFYIDVVKRYKEMEKIGIGDNYTEKQEDVLIGGLMGVRLNSHIIISVKNYSFVFDPTLVVGPSVLDQILPTFKFISQ